MSGYCPDCGNTLCICSEINPTPQGEPKVNRATHCKFGHEMTPENSKFIERKDGTRRECLICRNFKRARRSAERQNEFLQRKPDSKPTPQGEHYTFEELRAMGCPNELLMQYGVGHTREEVDRMIADSKPEAGGAHYAVEPIRWTIAHPDVGGPLEVVAASVYEQLKRENERLSKIQREIFGPAGQKHIGDLILERDTLTRKLAVAVAALKVMGDAATDTFEQMERGSWVDDHGHEVHKNAAMLDLLSAVKGAMDALAEIEGKK